MTVSSLGWIYFFDHLIAFMHAKRDILFVHLMNLFYPYPLFSEWINSQWWRNLRTTSFRLASRGSGSEWGTPSWRFMIENWELRTEPSFTSLPFLFIFSFFLHLAPNIVVERWTNVTVLFSKLSFVVKAIVEHIIFCRNFIVRGCPCYL